MTALSDPADVAPGDDHGPGRSPSDDRVTPPALRSRRRPLARVALRGIGAHRSRLVATVLAVMLGVSFMCGTAILADTVQASFNEVFADVYGRIDVVVRSDQTLGRGMGARRTRVSEQVLADVGAVPGVRAAEGHVEGPLRILDARGRPMYNPQAGPPTLGLNWLRTPELNGWSLVEGVAPATPDELVLDRRSAAEGGYRLGDRVRFVVAQGIVDRRLVGIATFSGLDTYSGSPAVLLETSEAQRLVGEPGRFSWVSADADDGVSADELAVRVRARGLADVQVLTGAELARERQDFVGQFVSLFTRLLSAFGLIALFVGSFLIFNTFAIIVGQRTRELALLRAVGASRRQVLGSVLTEATVIGLVSSLLGVVAGIGVARLLRFIIGIFGFELPDTPLKLVPARALLPVAAGLAVTTAAALIPALRAANTRPVAAMREATLDRPRHALVRLGLSAPFFTCSLAVAWWALRMDGDLAIAVALLAAVPAICGLAVAGPILAPPVATVVGAPLRRLTGITGRLAGRNAVRNPTRTSSTACALVIGVSLVCAIGVLAASLSAAVERTVDRTIAGDFVVMGNGPSGINPDVARRLGEVPGVAVATGVRFGAVGIGPVTAPGSPAAVAPATNGSSGGPASQPGEGSTPERAGEPGSVPPPTVAGGPAGAQPPGDDSRQELAIAADPAKLAGVVDLDVSSGSLDRLGAGQVAVAAEQARRDGVEVGDVVPIKFAIDGGRRVDAEVVAIYDRAVTRNGEYLFAVAGWDPHVPESARSDQRVLVMLDPGVSPAQIRPALDEAMAADPIAELLSVAAYRERQVGQVASRISYLYALLALAVLVGVLGIVNTLVLSVHERAREIGLMRAVGAQRRQVGVAVLQEAVLIAVPGAVFGVLFGVAIGWVVVQTVDFDTDVPTTIPVVWLLAVALGACLAGLVAGVYPAVRAGRVTLNDPSNMS